MNRGLEREITFFTRPRTALLAALTEEALELVDGQARADRLPRKTRSGLIKHFRQSGAVRAYAERMSSTAYRLPEDIPDEIVVNVDSRAQLVQDLTALDDFSRQHTNGARHLPLARRHRPTALHILEKGVHEFGTVRLGLNSTERINPWFRVLQVISVLDFPAYSGGEYEAGDDGTLPDAFVPYRDATGAVVSHHVALRGRLKPLTPWGSSHYR